MTADVGRDLTLSSLQDSDDYNSRQQSASGGLSYTFGGGGAGASFSYSRDKMNSNYDSVQEQTGIFAGILSALLWLALATRRRQISSIHHRSAGCKPLCQNQSLLSCNFAKDLSL
ncbi:hemagglutinin repeat-containing protein [Kosakonia sp. BYX6]|uniref:Hemagglutinin repeat-containing protein n=1 Tax=Kosakonia calanthes TaxID=3139408 RepID=A0ABZ3B6P7_9ENTR